MNVHNHSSYRVYWGMRSRCYNSNTYRYDRYGGRGITVCKRWLGESGFKNFIEDMGVRPSMKHTINRINNDGNYEPSNCEWATKHQQMMNIGLSRRNISGYKGVWWDKTRKCWLVYVSPGGKFINLGRYKDIKEAIEVRQCGEMKYYGI